MKKKPLCSTLLELVEVIVKLVLDDFALHIFHLFVHSHDIIFEFIIIPPI